MLQIRPLSENDIIKVISSCGGTVAHPDADRRTKKGADFVISDSVVELKMLDEDGLQKRERQKRVAKIFCEDGYDSPVVVLDKERLSASGKRLYDRAISGPIKKAISSAGKQLKQTRIELPKTTHSVLWILNNGYSALSDDDLAEIVEHRVRNDTSNIDGVILGGCFYHSDEFESFYLWPLRYIPIRLGKLEVFEDIKKSWNKFSVDFMTQVLREGAGNDRQASKGPVIDTEFEVDDRTYVKPAPPIGGTSDFFPKGRSRKNTTGITECPTVALTFPDLTDYEWKKFKMALPDEFNLGSTYEDWLAHVSNASGAHIELRPFVRIPITFEEWCSWARNHNDRSDMQSIYSYTSVVFQRLIQEKISNARQFDHDDIIPSTYVLVVTEEIGQDRANDLSHLAIVEKGNEKSPSLIPFIDNIRIFHEHSVALACAYAVSKNIENVLWIRDQKYAWA